MSSNIASGYTHEQDDVLKTLGLAVVAGQGVERLMSTCMAFVLRDEPLVSPEQLDGIMRRHSRAPLGQLLRILRDPVDLHPTFDERFERFLESRKSSRIACSTCRSAWTFIRTQAGRTSRRSCCASWMMAKPSSMILLGLIQIWSQQVGIDLPSVDDHPTQAMLDHVDENVMPNLSILSKEKMPSAGND